jgi:acylphosphatase
MSDASEPTVVRARISVTGRVQGVGYRAFVVRLATQRGLFGGVRNLDDGRVELEAEGPKDRILSLIEDLKAGPPASRVTDVHVEWGNATARHHDFRVWY